MKKVLIPTLLAAFLSTTDSAHAFPWGAVLCVTKCEATRGTAYRELMKKYQADADKTAKDLEAKIIDAKQANLEFQLQAQVFKAGTKTADLDHEICMVGCSVHFPSPPPMTADATLPNDTLITSAGDPVENGDNLSGHLATER
jgi:hypothetical protein